MQFLTSAPNFRQWACFLTSWLTTAASSPTLDQEKTALSWDSYASRQSDADQLRRQSLRCSWTSSLKQSADGPQAAGLVIQPLQTVAEDVRQWDGADTLGPKCTVNLPPPPFKLLLAIFYILTYLIWSKLTLAYEMSPLACMWHRQWTARRWWNFAVLSLAHHLWPVIQISLLTLLLCCTATSLLHFGNFAYYHTSDCQTLMITGTELHMDWIHPWIGFGFRFGLD